MTPPLQDDSTRSLRSLVMPYARPDRRKALWQLANTLPPLVGLWVLMALTLEWSRGWSMLLVVPVMLLAGAASVWLCYVQHQFERAYWARQDEWNPDSAAMAGSSLYDLPRVVHWFTANIGYHHIHHLSSRVPNYRLRECFESHPRLRTAPRFTFASSLRCARLKLWDEEAARMVGFAAQQA